MIIYSTHNSPFLPTLAAAANYRYVSVDSDFSPPVKAYQASLHDCAIPAQIAVRICVCMYVCMYVCMHVCTCSNCCVRLYIYVYMCMEYEYAQHTHTLSHTQCVCVYIYICMHSRTNYIIVSCNKCSHRRHLGLALYVNSYVYICANFTLQQVQP
jgi:hypothetical protein